LQGVIWNLSSGGIQVEIGSLQPADSVKLSFRLPQSGIVIDAVGTVVWAKEQRQGIQFTKISTTNQQAIQEIIVEAEKLD
jgi:hypothetical protein